MDSGGCIFCRIAAKEVPSQIVYEDEDFTAFRDLNPKAPVHVLLVPKKHYSTLMDFDSDSPAARGLIGAVRKIAESEKIGSDGFRLGVNCGKNAGQEVDHLHFHILGGRKFNWPPG